MSAEDAKSETGEDEKTKHSTAIKVAIWGFFGLVVAALIGGIFNFGAALINSNNTQPRAVASPPSVSMPSPSEQNKGYVASIGESVLEGYAVWSDSEPRVYGEVKGSLAQSDCSRGVNITFEGRDLDNRLVDKNDNPVCKKEDGRLKFRPVYFDTRVTKIDIVVFVDDKEVKRKICPRFYCTKTK